ncbi:MAG: RicAFT regulatory complex protein RicA family protein [Tuberibacillus sp.]
MTTFTREQILEKAGELAKMLAVTDEVAFFKKAEEQINKNEKVQSLIKQIKLLQKESVNLQHYQKFEALRENENKIDRLMDELDNIPLVREFKQSQKEVNDLLQYISSSISERVTEEITGEKNLTEQK